VSRPPSIREGAAEDIDPLLTIMERAFDPAFGEAWNRGQCLGIMSLPDVWLSFVEIAEGGTRRAVGFALSRLLVDEAELLLLAVEPDFRGRGFGQALIERTVRIAAGREAGRLLLEVRDGNIAFDLYRRCGFAVIGRRGGYYRGPGGITYDALTLARPIG